MLILASASPRRRQLLAQIGVSFETSAADSDEARRAGEPPPAYVERLAVEKARAVEPQYRDATILGADTTVNLGGHVLGKPLDRADAARMLRSLSGRIHHVHTGISVVSGGRAWSHVETTAVRFEAIAEVELEAYLATGDSLDKAGAYGIQGYAARWVGRIEGDFFNVMGLPLAAVVELLRQAGCVV